jgi:hypothetical protein
MKVQGKFKMQAHPTISVVMDVAAFKVSHSTVVDTDATALREPREQGQAPSMGQWMKCHGRFKMQTLTACDAKITSTRTVSSRVSKGSVQGAMKRYMRGCVGSIQHKTHVALPRYTANSEHTMGALDDTSRQVQKASTHCQHILL